MSRPVNVNRNGPQSNESGCVSGTVCFWRLDFFSITSAEADVSAGGGGGAGGGAGGGVGGGGEGGGGEGGGGEKLASKLSSIAHPINGVLANPQIATLTTSRDAIVSGKGLLSIMIN